MAVSKVWAGGIGLVAELAAKADPVRGSGGAEPPEIPFLGCNYGFILVQWSQGAKREMWPGLVVAMINCEREKPKPMA